MPYRSKSQMRKFFAMASRGEIAMNTAKEWAHKTKSIKKLPEHMMKKKREDAEKMIH